MSNKKERPVKEDVCPVCGNRTEDCVCCPECGHVCALDGEELYCHVCGPFKSAEGPADP